MAAPKPISVDCPACGEAITVPIVLTALSRRRADDLITVNLRTSRNAVAEHMATHRRD